MRQFLKDFVNTKLKLPGVVLSVFASIIQLTSLAFPTLPDYVRIIALIFFLSVVVYVLFEFFRFSAERIGDKLESLSYQISNEVTEKLIEKISPNDIEITQSEAESSFLFSARRYGIGYDVQEIKCIIDRDGSAEVQRSSTILAFSVINSIDTYLLVPESAIEGEQRTVGFLNIESLSPDRNVIITNKKNESQRQSVEISFAPPLRSGDEAQILMEEELPNGLFAIDLTQEQINQRKKPYDYFAWNINRPTRHLKLQIFIPDSYTPGIYQAEVYYASASGFPDERVQYEEQKRIQNPVRTIVDGRCILTLEVDYPMIGLIYMVRWNPKVGAS